LDSAAGIQPDAGRWGPTSAEVILPVSSLPKTHTLCQTMTWGNFTQSADPSLLLGHLTPG